MLRCITKVQSPPGTRADLLVSRFFIHIVFFIHIPHLSYWDLWNRSTWVVVDPHLVGGRIFIVLCSNAFIRNTISYYYHYQIVFFFIIFHFSVEYLFLLFLIDISVWWLLSNVMGTLSVLFPRRTKTWMRKARITFCWNKCNSCWLSSFGLWNTFWQFASFTDLRILIQSKSSYKYSIVWVMHACFLYI